MCSLVRPNMRRLRIISSAPPNPVIIIASIIHPSASSRNIPYLLYYILYKHIILEHGPSFRMHMDRQNTRAKDI